MRVTRRKSLVLMLMCVTACCSTVLADTQIRVTPDNFELGLRSLQHVQGRTTITFAAGEYFLNGPIEIPPTAGPLLLESAGNAVISGGLPVTGWRKVTFNGHECFAADMPGVRAGRWYFRELWVNGKRAMRSRYPASGYLSAALPVDEKTPWNQGQNWFGFKPADLPEGLPTADVEAVIMNRWTEARLPITRVDQTAHRYQSVKRSPFQLLNGDLYFLEGSPRWLDHAGEWYLDREKGTLYYLPREGETIETLHVIAPRLACILKMKGASNVAFRGLTFSNSEWNLPDEGDGAEMEVGGFGQAAIGVPAAVSLEFCHDCKFVSCTFDHLGNYALELGKGCQHDVVERCNFTDIGAGSIKIGTGEQSANVTEQTFGNTVADCRITDGGHMFPSACGIWIGQSYDNQIEHNEIADLYYTGISVGWTWGYGPSLAHGNRFEANLVHDIGKKSNGDGPILSDMGAIYTLGTREGTVISGNVFHDIYGRVYGGWGVYLDEGSSNTLVEKNLVYRTTHGGFHLHYGHDNTVLNNIFALGRDIQIARTQSEKQQAITFKHNIVYWDSGLFTATDPAGVSFDDNLYQCIGKGHLKFYDKTWAQWQGAGEDVHSILGDAGFANPSHGDFAMKKDAAAKRIGFEPLQIGDAGPRHSP